MLFSPTPCNLLSSISTTMEEPGGLQSMGWLRVGHDWVTSFSLFHFHALEKEMATHFGILAWRIPGAGEPGGLTSMGSHRVGHNWSDLTAAAVYQLPVIPLMLKKQMLNILWRPARTSGTNTPKRFPFHCRGLEWKSRKPRDTWSNRKNWPWSPKRS